VSFGSEISPETSRRVHSLTRALQSSRGILNLHPAFTSLLVEFDLRLCSHGAIEDLVREKADAIGHTPAPPGRTVEISAVFDGPDLETVARHAGLERNAVIARFCAADYTVAFVGFATCFPYLSGLPAELATPRLETPRRQVPEGSIAIGGSQAGVYPLPSPGGWRIIGRTSLRLFDRNCTPPGLLGIGDSVRFLPQ
jgi:inhibitor of KinA